MRTALDVHRFLLAADVPHEMVRLDQRITTADDLPDSLGPGVCCVAVRLYHVSRWMGVTPRPTWAAVLVPAGAVPDRRLLLLALGAEDVRPATASEANSATGYPSELVSPVALDSDVEVLADTALGVSDVVYVAAGEGGLALGIRTRDLLVAVGARAATLTPARLPVPRPRFADIVDLDRADLDDGLERHRS